MRDWDKLAELQEKLANERQAVKKVKWWQLVKEQVMLAIMGTCLAVSLLIIFGWLVRS